MGGMMGGAWVAERLRGDGAGRPAEAAGSSVGWHRIKIMILTRHAQLKQKMRMMFGFFDDNWKKMTKNDTDSIFSLASTNI